MMKCCSCGSDLIELWDLGQQPVSFQFKSDADCVPLKLCECICCGLIQLEQSIDEVTLRTMPEWMGYSEPEAHLSQLAEFCRKECAMSQRTRVQILSQHDLPLAAALDLPTEGLEENSQAYERPNPWVVEEMLNQWIKDNITCEVVLARRIFEHFEYPGKILDMLRRLNCRYLVLELPDSTKSLVDGDVTMIWEEHKTYFTLDTLKNTLAANGWDIIAKRIWEDAQEDVLVVIATPAAPLVRPPTFFKEGQNFGSRFVVLCEQHAQNIRSFLAAAGTSAILGVGHRCAAFVNYNCIQNYVSSAHDDNEYKSGQFLPGTNTQITSTRKIDLNTRIGLLAMSSARAIKVRNSLQEKYNKTKFKSIFPCSPLFRFH